MQSARVSHEKIRRKQNEALSSFSVIPLANSMPKDELGRTSSFD